MNRAAAPATPLTIKQANFEAVVLQSETPILLQFWASWCVPCMIMKRALPKVAHELSGKVLVGLINIDEQPELVARHQVQGTPTFIAYSGGKVVGTFAGLFTASGLTRRVTDLLS